MTRVLTYTLTLEEPCLLAPPGGDPNTEKSLPYIPGGAMRGALAAAFLRNDRTGGPTFDDLFLNGKVRYLNAYPLLRFEKDKNSKKEEIEKVRALPMPRAWTKLKDDKDEKIYNRTVKALFDEADKNIPSGVGVDFVTFDPSVTSPQIAYEIAVHTARNRGKGRSIEGDRDSALFRYQALARDQQFTGAIVFDDENDAAAIEKLLGGSLLLGGSHNAGYGLVTVTRQSPSPEDGQKKNTWREVEDQAKDIPAEGAFIVYLTSHAILYDPNTGQPTADILHFLPGGPARYVCEHSFAAADWVGGFNKHRGLPLSQQWAVLMGSTWVVKTKKPISVQDITDLEAKGIGVRTEEGFGRLVINPQWPQEKFELENKDSSGAQPQDEPETRATEAAHGRPAVPVHPLLEQMNKRIARAELDRRLAVRVNKLAGSKIRGHLSRSQLGRLQVRVRRVATDDDYNFQNFITYLDRTKERKSADDQFRKFTVGDDNFRDYLRKLAGNPTTIWREINAQGGEMTYVGPAAYDFSQDEELAAQYTVKFIANLCRQLSKLEERP